MPDTAGLDLWISASRLCERCEISIGTVALPPGWRVTIRPKRRAKDATGPDHVTAMADHLLDATAEAIRLAEKRGF